ncbi:MAG: enoyl-CoA hydratase/isomerase family protein, partial [Gammaproteobacteria bacterium]|nr:enoyl-CoA hydratase/isomerase family protein [Gammaproteobacteria bacterium]MBT6949672.1 enoyl-CoA hydratase/isomerase family protein [Gammaproteobacteria bacterium]
MEQDAILITTHGAVKVISINDAPINRMSLAFMDMLEQEVAAIGQDDSIRAVVLTAEGEKNFSVG